MAKRASNDTPSKASETRQDRLKAALKANMGRRKAQARARTAHQAVDAGKDRDQKGE